MFAELPKLQRGSEELQGVDMSSSRLHLLEVLNTGSIIHDPPELRTVL